MGGLVAPGGVTNSMFQVENSSENTPSTNAKWNQGTGWPSTVRLMIPVRILSWPKAETIRSVTQPMPPAVSSERASAPASTGNAGLILEELQVGSLEVRVHPGVREVGSNGGALLDGGEVAV